MQTYESLNVVISRKYIDGCSVLFSCIKIVYKIGNKASHWWKTLNYISPVWTLSFFVLPLRALSDLNKDGKMDQQEFSIAMKLIKLKLQGQHLPMVLPPVMKQTPVLSPLMSARFGTY